MRKILRVIPQVSASDKHFKYLIAVEASARFNDLHTHTQTIRAKSEESNANTHIKKNTNLGCNFRGGYFGITRALFSGLKNGDQHGADRDIKCN